MGVDRSDARDTANDRATETTRRRPTRDSYFK